MYVRNSSDTVRWLVLKMANKGTPIRGSRTGQPMYLIAGCGWHESHPALTFID